MNDAARLAALLLEEDGAWDFVSTLESDAVSVTGVPENWELQSSQCVVKWHLDIEARRWGVKEFNPNLMEVTAFFGFDVIDPETGDAVGTEEVELRYPSPETTPGDGDVKSAIDHYAQNVQAEVQWNIRSGEEHSPSVYPKEVEIDLRTNQIIVFF